MTEKRVTDYCLFFLLPVSQSLRYFKLSTQTHAYNKLLRVVCRPSGETGLRLPHELGLFCVLVPTPILPASVGCPRCVSFWPCSCSAAAKRYDSQHYSLSHANFQICFLFLDSHRLLLRVIKRNFLSPFRSPLLTLLSLWRSSGAATRTSALTTSVPRPLQQVICFPPSTQVHKMHLHQHRLKICFPL